jgi:hypothetical protein
MPTETEKLLEDLKEWCDQERGRRVQVANLLDTPRQTIANWFAAKQQPTGEQALVVFKFLEEQKKKKKN